jgi:glucans biosynthesis protein
MFLLRRHFLALAAGTTLGGFGPGAGLSRALAEDAGAVSADAPVAFGFDELQAKAEELARSPFNGGSFSLPPVLADLNVPTYQEIRYRNEAALWRDDPSRFRVVFRHLGSFYRRPITVHVVDGGTVTEVAYRGDLFDYGSNDFAGDLPSDLGFAGLTIHHAESGPDHYPEIATFHGASYFRLLGHGQQYGISARGLAIDTGLDKGEEFPFFKEFWLERPRADAASIRIFALLDSPSITGAYRFDIHPGVVLTTEVQAVLFPRQPVAKLGFAPLTSMFMFGENRGRQFDDYRPEVHDSDGLLIHNGRDEWLWRPLANHSDLQISAFVDDDPKGFGLFQRDRDFENYQDLDDRYQDRPSIWVEPTSAWGPGHVELLEIPSDHPDNDNVVAFWVADAPVEAGRPIAFSYRLHAQLDQPRRPPLGRVEATRIGPARGDDGRFGRRFVVDFAGGRLNEVAPDAPVTATVKAHQGELGPFTLRANPVNGGWRLAFDLYPNGEPLCEMRASLHVNDEQISEIWTYRWTSG